ncbi:P-II family nitrogen regulator [Fusicatenibacter sp.]
MHPFYLMLTVADRRLGEKYLNFYLEHQIDIQFVTLGRGTVRDDMLDYFGLESHEKAILFSLISLEQWLEIQHGLWKQLHVDIPGTGIAFLIPLSSIGSRGLFTYLSQKLNVEPNKEETILQNTEYEMIVAVTNQGYTEPVMQAARSAGAGGGTVIHAKGTGMEGMGKFFGVTLAAEKEMIFIVTETAKKKQIMQTIMEQAGMTTKAKTILFSLPVTHVCGLTPSDAFSPLDTSSVTSHTAL